MAPVALFRCNLLHNTVQVVESFGSLLQELFKLGTFSLPTVFMQSTTELGMLCDQPPYLQEGVGLVFQGLDSSGLVQGPWEAGACISGCISRTCLTCLTLFGGRC